MRHLAVALLILGVSFPAFAACRWEWVCDGSGNCENVPICDHSIDVLPPRPPSIEPIAPPSVRPVPTPTVPPVGTQSCTQVQRQDDWGNWVWDTVCY
jgi:hypothetical protein